MRIGLISPFRFVDCPLLASRRDAESKTTPLGRKSLGVKKQVVTRLVVWPTVLSVLNNYSHKRELPQNCTLAELYSHFSFTLYLSFPGFFPPRLNLSKRTSPQKRITKTTARTSDVIPKLTYHDNDVDNTQVLVNQRVNCKGVPHLR